VGLFGAKQTQSHQEVANGKLKLIHDKTHFVLQHRQNKEQLNNPSTIAL